MGAETVSVRCCIAGGGPAGMMLGLLLARAGVDVLVLEKHIDFLRDFRGDTIHPSTLEVMHELGVLERLLAIAPPESAADQRAVRRSGVDGRGFFVSLDAVSLYRLHAAMGLFELSRRRGGALFDIPAADAS